MQLDSSTHFVPAPSQAAPAPPNQSPSLVTASLLLTVAQLANYVATCTTAVVQLQMQRWHEHEQINMAVV